jgi:hypothetical protein
MVVFDNVPEKDGARGERMGRKVLKKRHSPSEMLQRLINL